MGRLKKTDRYKIIAENKSTTLKISPPSIKKLLTRSKPPANKRKGIATSKPNVSIRNATAAERSISPRIFTNTIKILKK